MSYTFNEFETLASRHYRIGLFFKAYKYVRPTLEQLYLHATLSLEDLSKAINLSIKKATKLVKDLSDRQIIVYNIRNSEWYITITLKGRELLQFLEK